MRLYLLLPVVAVAAQNETAALNSPAWKLGLQAWSFPIAWATKRPSRRAQSKNPGAGRPLPRLADDDGRDERTAARRVLGHEMLQRLGHLMNGAPGPATSSRALDKPPDR